MPAARREEIADIVRRHKAVVLEDDVYTFLHPAPPPSLFSLLPDMVFHVSSFAKSAAGGLRIGVLLLPTWAKQRTALAFRHSSWMAAPIMAALAVRLIVKGSLEQLVASKRREARLRWDLARGILGSQHVPAIGPSFQLWLSPTRPIADFVSAAAIQGVILAPPSQMPGDPAPPGIRVCIGAPERIEDLRNALHVIGSVLNQGTRYSLI